MDERITTPPACASPVGALPLSAPTPPAGAQTGRAVRHVATHGEGCSPDAVTIAYRGVAHTIDVTPDRDDWSLPDAIDDADAHLVMAALDDAIEAYGADYDASVRAA